MKDDGVAWANLARLDKGGRVLRRIASLALPETLTAPVARIDPRWAEWLMGFPNGWTAAEACAPYHRGWAVDPAELPPAHPGYVPRTLADKGVGRAPRIKALGNAQVPTQAAYAWLLLSEMHP